MESAVTLDDVRAVCPELTTIEQAIIWNRLTTPEERKQQLAAVIKEWKAMSLHARVREPVEFRPIEDGGTCK